MGGRILVIEDNPANLELMMYILKAFGHTAIAARDGEEGVDLALTSNPDVILCDLAMPKLDGFEVARRLKSEPAVRFVPLIAVTASAMVGDRDNVLAQGFDGYISKPIILDTFVAEVERNLAAHAQVEHRSP